MCELRPWNLRLVVGVIVVLELLGGNLRRIRRDFGVHELPCGVLPWVYGGVAVVELRELRGGDLCYSSGIECLRDLRCGNDGCFSGCFLVRELRGWAVPSSVRPKLVLELSLGQLLRVWGALGGVGIVCCWHLLVDWVECVLELHRRALPS